jgi:DNA primase
MRFRKDWLPDPLNYHDDQCTNLKGLGKWRRALCVFHDDKSPSLSVNIENGAFICFSCDTKGGDVLSFHMIKYGLGFVDAAKELGAWDA